jgi:hypothetical protein
VFRKLFDRFEGRRFAVLAVALVVSLCLAGVWVFSAATSSELERSLWSLILSDRSTLGFLRAAIIGLSIYAIASVAALIASGRWIRSFRSTGFEAEALSSDDLQRAQEDAAIAKSEREELSRLLGERLDG